MGEAHTTDPDTLTEPQAAAELDDLRARGVVGPAPAGPSA